MKKEQFEKLVASVKEAWACGSDWGSSNFLHVRVSPHLPHSRQGDMSRGESITDLRRG